MKNGFINWVKNKSLLENEMQNLGSAEVVGPIKIGQAEVVLTGSELEIDGRDMYITLSLTPQQVEQIKNEHGKKSPGFSNPNLRF